jgi:L-fucose isomerase-like protein
MFGKELTGVVPWIANVNKVTEKVSVFAHCTIAPTLVKNYQITTHYETGLGTAIQGEFISDLVTIFRFDNLLSKMFVTKAEVIGRPKSESACRTQIEVKLPNSAVKLLKETPLGNHHLILPGNHIDKLNLACKILDIAVVF